MANGGVGISNGNSGSSFVTSLAVAFHEVLLAGLLSSPLFAEVDLVTDKK